VRSIMHRSNRSSHHMNLDGLDMKPYVSTAVRPECSGGSGGGGGVVVVVKPGRQRLARERSVLDGWQSSACIAALTLDVWGSDTGTYWHAPPVSPAGMHSRLDTNGP
jgi:hypothetical protein